MYIFNSYNFGILYIKKKRRNDVEKLILSGSANVEKILAEEPAPNNRYLEILGDYIMGALTKEEKREKKYLTDNRMITINKRETSFEGLAEKFENGEDGIYNLMTEDKNQIFQPKVSITKKDLEEIEPLKQLREAIEYWEEKLKTTEGKDAFTIKRTLIELRKDQYVIKNAYRKPIVFTQAIKSKNFIYFVIYLFF